ncbi:MAG: cysteine hydrolase [Syntrophomonadaceae bacterium]|nr:cysteine hydrolase [Syntrophomonadaceae bacterium]
MAEQKEVLEIYQAMEKVVGEARPVNLDSLVNEAGGPEQVVLVLVDLVQGFAREGPLASPRVAALIEPITKLAEEALRLGVGITVIRDAHSEDCPEFDQFGRHCVKGSAEAELVSELKEVLGPNYIDWPKNCLAAGQAHAQSTVIIVGDCTDLCVYQAAMGEKLAANARGIRKRVIVPVNLVDTYDLPVEAAKKLGLLPHPGDFFHLVFLYHLKLNGIELVRLV